MKPEAVLATLKAELREAADAKMEVVDTGRMWHREACRNVLKRIEELENEP